MTWEEINRKRLPFIRFGENLFKQMYGEIRKMYIASLQDLKAPEEITQATEVFRFKEDIVVSAYERFYLKTALAYARDQIKAHSSHLEEKDLNDDMLNDIWYKKVMDFIKTKVGNNISNVTLTTYKDIQAIARQAVKEGIEKGWGMDKIARAITTNQREIESWKALRIARTEVVTASNEGVKLGYQQLPGNKQKVWISTFDQRSRPDHMAMDGVRVAVNEYFNLPGGGQLEYPGDADGRPGDIINCRCGYEIIVVPETY